MIGNLWCHQVYTKTLNNPFNIIVISNNTLRETLKSENENDKKKDFADVGITFNRDKVICWNFVYCVV